MIDEHDELPIPPETTEDGLTRAERLRDERIDFELENRRMKTLLTHIGNELAVLVHYDYQPIELKTRNYPGCEDSATINEVLHGDADLLDVLSKECIRNLEEQCIEHTVNAGEY